MRVDHVFEDFGSIKETAKTLKAGQAESFPLPRNFACLKHMVDTYETQCAKLQDYDLQYVKYFVKECEQLDGTTGVEAVIKGLVEACQH